jgi:hypothetical protein
MNIKAKIMNLNMNKIQYLVQEVMISLKNVKKIFDRKNKSIKKYFLIKLLE